MIRITNISITDAAKHVIDRRKAAFKPPGDYVFALTYTSSFINRDGSTVEGFRPGYEISPWPLGYIGPAWMAVRLAHGTEFHLMPRFRWDAERRYIMDLISLPHETFSIVQLLA